MYKIFVDGNLFCDSRVDDLSVINPILDLEVNKAGSFEFSIPPMHPYYDSISKRTSLVYVYRNDESEPLFAGVCVSIEDDFYKQRKIVCEGELSFFNDTTQRPARYQGYTVIQLLQAYIANHNAMCESFKHFTLGMVTVSDPNNSIYCYTNYETTMECLQDDLVDDLGGYFRIRHVDGVRYLDYLADSMNSNRQAIKLGENLVDFTTNLDTTEICTSVIPLGAKLEESSIEGLDERLTIKSINGGKDYLRNADAVSAYGVIEKVVVWNDVTTETALKAKGQAYLTSEQFENMIIEANAIDLHYDNDTVESFKLFDKIRVVSAPHGIDKWFLLSKMKINLNYPENDRITLGTTSKNSLTARSMSEEDVDVIVEDASLSLLQIAKSNATELIKYAGNGYVSITYDEDMSPTEICIMDSPSKESATKVWRWNVNGLGYSSTGYNGEYGLAMTMDGAIVADKITTGKLSTARLSGNITANSDVTIEWEGIDGTDGVVTDLNKTTKIGKNYIDTLSVKAGSVDAENITGTTITGKTIVGGTIKGAYTYPRRLRIGGKYDTDSTYGWADFFTASTDPDDTPSGSIYVNNRNNGFYITAQSDLQLSSGVDNYIIANQYFKANGGMQTGLLRLQDRFNVGITPKEVNYITLGFDGGSANIDFNVYASRYQSAYECGHIYAEYVYGAGTADKRQLIMANDNGNACVYASSGIVDLAGGDVYVHADDLVDIAGSRININGDGGSVDIHGSEVKVAGNIFDLDTENTTDTWIPVKNGSFLQHTTIYSIVSRGSSKRYKHDIEPMADDRAKKILDVDVVTFDYNDGVIPEDEIKNHNLQSNDVSGVIAEDVVEIIPEVIYSKEVDGEIVPDRVDYSKFVPYLIKMVQMQDKKIKELEEIING